VLHQLFIIWEIRAVMRMMLSDDNAADAFQTVVDGVGSGIDH
jgi:hypothetical protein